jgi:hypothetical protein
MDCSSSLIYLKNVIFNTIIGNAWLLYKKKKIKKIIINLIYFEQLRRHQSTDLCYIIRYSDDVALYRN